MRVCHVTPHLPPDQGANALLPVLLAAELASQGVVSTLISHPATRAGAHDADHVTRVRRRSRGPVGTTRAGAVLAAARMAYQARAVVAAADLVHLHSNGLLIEVAAFLAGRVGKPWVITLYGTDIWDHDAGRHRRFGRLVRDASARAFYSHGLLTRAVELGLADPPATVIHAPAARSFTPLPDEERRELRRALAADGRVLVVVKRLHPLTGHRDLIAAMPAVLEHHPDSQLWVIGDGELRGELEQQSRSEGLEQRIRFLGAVPNAEVGRYLAAADLFVLPSIVEAWPTVLIEALACGTPVVATETAGGREVAAEFPNDVVTCPVRDVTRLAAAIVEGLDDRRRVTSRTAERLGANFSASACADAYLALYRLAVSGVPSARGSRDG